MTKQMMSVKSEVCQGRAPDTAERSQQSEQVALAEKPHAQTMYKGFDKNMQCRGFQFKEGETYHEEKAELCNTGFHACENPLDCYGYYAPGNGSVYREVELDEVSDERENDTKRVGKTIKIGAELSVANICKAHFEYVKSKCVSEKERVAGDSESASAGNFGSASAGNFGSASAGNFGSASARDSGSASAGYRGSASVGSFGSASAGYRGSASAGDFGSASAGECGIAACRGGRVKGGLGAVIACAELDDDGQPISCACAIVDGETIKADTWYRVKDGKFVEEGEGK